MKKTFLLTLMLSCITLISAQNATKPKIYVNPFTYSEGTDISQAECLSASNSYMMGINKARHIDSTRGKEKLEINVAAAKGYDYLLTVNVKSVTAERGKEILSGKELNTYDGNCVVYQKLTDVRTGKVLVESEISKSCVSNSMSEARYESTTLLTSDALAMIDDALPLVATQVNLDEADDKKVKTAILNLGKLTGVRKGMMFEISMIKDNQNTPLATAKVFQVLDASSCRVDIKSRKDGEKKLLDAFNNADENTTIVARSRAINSLAAWGKELLGSFVGGVEDKGDSYPSDINRTVKPKVALYKFNMATQLSDNVSDALVSAVSKAFNECSTIQSGTTKATDIEEATQEGWNALIEVTITNVSTVRGKDVKNLKGETVPSYSASVAMSLYAIDAGTGAGINLRNITEEGVGDSEEKAMSEAFENVTTPARIFFDDVFPVESRLESATKYNKKQTEVKEASLHIGSSMGVQKNTKFDIFKQNLSVGEDSREMIGHGEVKEVPETDTSLLTIQSGGNKVAEILQGNDPDAAIVVVSRGHKDKTRKILKGLGLGGIL